MNKSFGTSANDLICRLLLIAALLLTTVPASGQTSRAGDHFAVPMQLCENGLYPAAFALVRVEIDGCNTTLLLDTGASIHVLSAEFARKTALKPGGTLQALGASETRIAPRVRLPTLSLGDIEFHDQQAILLDDLRVFDRLQTQHGVRVEGLLGAPVFKHAPVTLDFDAGKMIFHDPKSFDPPEFSTCLALGTLHGIPTLEASLGDNVPASFLVDTGHSNPLLIHGPYGQDKDLLRNKHSLLRYGMKGMFGQTEAYMGLLPKVCLGEQVVSDLPTTVVSDQRDKGLAHNSESAGNIGLALLTRFRVTFDFAAGKLYLEPRESTTVMPSDFGLSLTLSNGRVVIEEVGRDSPANAVGLQPMDRIIAIEGRSCPRSVTETIRILRASDGLRIMVRRGRERSFTVKLEKRGYLPYLVKRGG